MNDPSFWEQFEQTEEAAPPSGRWLGFALALLLGWIGLAPARHGGHPYVWALIVSAALVLVAIFLPGWLHPAGAAWWRLLRPVRRAIAASTMALLFFLVITPASWLRRLFARDPLGLRCDPAAPTYWRTRQPISPEAMKHQF